MNKDMKQRLFSMVLLLCLGMQWVAAQAPKWVEKAKRAVFSVVTYDRNDKILNTGNGFFVSEDGVALSDYALFKGAQRAVILTPEGVQMPVDAVLGANEMYDVVKFRVTISGKKVAALTVAAMPPVADATIYLLPYSTQKDRSYTAGRVKEADKVSGYDYYTLDMRLADKMVSCPVVTAEGQVFGMAQKANGQDTATICYAVDVRFAMAQSITALSFGDRALKDIGIRKALPDTEEQALAYLYMASSQLAPDEYAGLLDEFVASYPNSSEGYVRRAASQLQRSTDDASMMRVSADLDKALEVSDKKDDAYYNRAKLMYSYLLQGVEKPYKDWSYEKALAELDKAIALEPLPVYTQLQGDILYAKQEYAAAAACYEKVNQTNLASPATYFSAAKAKELAEAPAEEVLALMDSCVTRFSEPYTQEAAPYLLERAQMRMNAGQARTAMLDYDAYFNAVNGRVNDVFYYYREQAALKARQFQRALDDIAKAVELNPQELSYQAEQAVVNLRVGRYEEAQRILQTLLAGNPSYADAYRLMGLVQLQLKQQDKACENFAKAKELGDPYADDLIEKHCK